MSIDWIIGYYLPVYWWFRLTLMSKTGTAIKNRERCPLCILQTQRHWSYAAANKEDEEAQKAKKDQIRKKQSAIRQLAAQLNENSGDNKIPKQFVILIG